MSLKNVLHHCVLEEWGPGVMVLWRSTAPPNGQGGRDFSSLLLARVGGIIHWMPNGMHKFLNSWSAQWLKSRVYEDILNLEFYIS